MFFLENKILSPCIFVSNEGITIIQVETTTIRRITTRATTIRTTIVRRRKKKGFGYVRT